jgi:hypothetical protein
MFHMLAAMMAVAGPLLSSSAAGTVMMIMVDFIRHTCMMHCRSSNLTTPSLEDMEAAASRTVCHTTSSVLDEVHCNARLG